MQLDLFDIPRPVHDDHLRRAQVALSMLGDLALLHAALALIFDGSWQELVLRRALGLPEDRPLSASYAGRDPQQLIELIAAGSLLTHCAEDLADSTSALSLRQRRRVRGAR